MTALTDSPQATAPADSSAPIRPAFWTAPRDGFPARADTVTWPRTALSAEKVMSVLMTSPFRHHGDSARRHVQRGLPVVLGWLEEQSGETWQQRWLASGVEKLPGRRWMELPLAWAAAVGCNPGSCPQRDLASALLMMTCADVVRPRLRWFFTRVTTHLAPAMAQTRDPEGFRRLQELCDSDPKISKTDRTLALSRIATIMAAKGGLVTDITVGDCLDLIDAQLENHAGGGGHKESFYRLLRAAGALSPDAPVTLRMFKARGQLSPEELIDRYRIQCRSIRDLLVDYLRERQPRLDYASLNSLADDLGRLFWRELEHHHPGIDSLHLPPVIATAWKERITVKTVKVKDARGHVTEVKRPRETKLELLTAVRSFYLDIAQWAAEEPERWAQWAAPCPIREAELDRTKSERRRKAKTDQRTRERLPVLPVLIRTAEQCLTTARARLEAARRTAPGQTFTVGGQTLLRPVTPHGHANKIWGVDPDAEPGDGQGKGRRDLILEEDRAFWAWATVEVLRHTGIRLEELLELSHHSFIQYRLPSTGELVPLLQVAPSKTDQERLILVVPELADVLSAIVQRVREPGGAIPVIPSYDALERTWLPPMPLLFQRPVFTEHRRLPRHFIRDVINDLVEASGLTDTEGRPLKYSPHDFRRLFVTDAVMNGLPPHIAQVICGHRDINTTLGYKAIYPQEAIEAHRLFIATRRSQRPSAEYRTPTDEEWDEFLAHFEKRKVSVGTCARAYGTPCIHEHACVRCPMLRPDPAQLPRLLEIRDNLIARIAEAEREGWLGEIEGLQVSLAGTKEKITQAHASATPRTVQLGIPTHRASWAGGK
jgi:hypothetical protein